MTLLQLILRSWVSLVPLFSLKKSFITVCADNTRRYGVVFCGLQQQLGYTLHRQARKLFCHNRVIVFDIDSQWQAELLDMLSLS